VNVFAIVELNPLIFVHGLGVMQAFMTVDLLVIKGLRSHVEVGGIQAPFVAT